MKKTQVTLITLLLLIFTVTSSYSSEKFSYGLKTGLNFSRFIIDRPFLGNPEYPYPAGLYAGTFFELKLSNVIAIASEISYLKMRSKIKGSTTSLGLRNMKFIGDYITLPISFKLSLFGPTNPYFMVGSEFGYLLNATHEWYDEFDTNDKGKEDIKKQLPSFDNSINIGLGKKLR